MFYISDEIGLALFTLICIVVEVELLSARLATKKATISRPSPLSFPGHVRERSAFGYHYRQVASFSALCCSMTRINLIAIADQIRFFGITSFEQFRLVNSSDEN